MGAATVKVFHDNHPLLAGNNDQNRKQNHNISQLLTVIAERVWRFNQSPGAGRRGWRRWRFLFGLLTCIHGSLLGPWPTTTCRDVDVGHKTLQNGNSYGGTWRFMKCHFWSMISTNTVSNLMNMFCMNFVVAPKVGAWPCKSCCNTSHSFSSCSNRVPTVVWYDCMTYKH